MKVSWSAIYLPCVGLVLNLMVFGTVIASEPMASSVKNDEFSALIKIPQVQVKTYQVPPGSVQSALITFAEQSGLELFYPSELTDGLQTPGVSGELSVEQALDELLKQTSVIYEVSPSGTIQLKESQSKNLTDEKQISMQESQDQKDLEQDREPVVVNAPEVVIKDIRKTGYVSADGTTGTKTDTPLIETPQSISVITRERLAIQDVSTLSEALRYTPGIQGETFGNDSRVDFLRLRGFNDNGNAIFRDGLQLRNSGFGQFRTEIYGMERVDVLRGPSSFLYGQGNPGGIVNLISKRPTRSLFREVEFEAGNFNHYEGKFDLSGPFDKNGKFLYRLTGMARSSDTQLDFVDNDRFFLAPAVTWQPWDSTSLTILSHIQNDQTGSTNQFLPVQGTVKNNPNGDIPTHRFTGEQNFDKFERTEYSVGYLFEHQFNERWLVRQKARYSHLDTDFDNVFGGGLEADLRTLNRSSFTALAETDGFTIDTHAQGTFTTGPLSHTVLFGVGYQRYDFEEAQGFDAAPSLDIFNPVYGASIPRPPLFLETVTIQEQVGVYGQGQVKAFDRAILTLSGRGDFLFGETKDKLAGNKQKQDDSEFSGRAGLVYLFDIGLAPYASYSKAFLPTLGTDASGKSFEPTIANGYEFGLKYQVPDGKSLLTVSFFNIRQKNVLTPDPNNIFDQVQTGAIRSRGIEFEGNVQFPFGLNLIASYTYQGVEVTKSNGPDKGKRPITVPKHHASVWGDYTIQSGLLNGLGIGLGVRYKGDSFGNEANTLKVDDFTLVDGTIFYDWKIFRFDLIAKNMFNNKHVAACNTASACFFGAARTIVGTIRLRW